MHHLHLGFIDLGVSHHVAYYLNNLAIHGECDGINKILIDNGNVLPITHIRSMILPVDSSKFLLNDILCPKYKKKLALYFQA